MTVVWGTTFTLVKAALDDISTLLFLALRFSLAGVALLALYRSELGAGSSRGGRAWQGGAAAGICLVVSYLLQTFGLKYTTPSKSAFLTSLCVVLVPLLGGLVYKSVPRAAEAAGASVAIAGMGLLTLPEGRAPWNAGDLLTVGAAAGFAAHVLVIGHYAPRTGFPVLSVVQVVTAAALSGLAAGFAEPAMVRWSVAVVAAIAVTGLLCTALAFTVQAWAQQHTTPNRTALIFALEPVSAWITSYLAQGEVLTARAGAGAALILCGVLAAEWKPGGSRKHRKSEGCNPL